jgi:methionyl aminopeptidase
MTEAGRILEIVHEEMKKALRPGMSTKDIDRIGEEVIRSYGCIPSFSPYLSHLYSHL